jgi:hypothetical protein
MTKKLRLALLVSVICIALPSLAVETPLEKYKVEAEDQILLCAISFKLAQMKETSDKTTDYEGCISKAKVQSKTNYTKAMSTVKQPKAQDALKTYHVAIITALEGIKSGLDERVVDYKPRQMTLADSVTEAWARFEIEQ